MANIMQRRNLKARYHVRGPTKEPVTYVKCTIDENKNVKMQEVTEEMDCYRVMFPQGHSIRVTSFERLKELGYHIKPRLVDMDTGDVVDVGGDPYDFSQQSNDNIHLEDEELPSRKRAKAEAATA